MSSVFSESTAPTRPGELTRQKILQFAANLASIEGLEGLTIGRLAKALQMSKSGLFAHFGSKESLQLAVIESAREVFEREAIEPAMAKPAGLERFRALLDYWLGYIEQDVFQGGCFFFAAAMEFDSRPGVVGNRLMELFQSWTSQLVEEAGLARENCELDASADPAQLAFECLAMVQHANSGYQLFQDASCFERARKGIRFRLEYASRNIAARKKETAGQELLF